MPIQYKCNGCGRPSGTFVCELCAWGTQHTALDSEASQMENCWSPAKPKAMGGQWKKKDGSTVAISDMTDSHIQNSINMLQRGITRLEVKVEAFKVEQGRRADERRKIAEDNTKRLVPYKKTRMFRDDDEDQ